MITNTPKDAMHLITTHKPPVARRYRVAMLTALIAAAGCASFVSSSPAAETHGFAGVFGGVGSGDGGLSLVSPEVTVGKSGRHHVESAGSSVAVDDVSGLVLVADTGNHRVSVFDPSKPAGEEFVRSFGADVGGAGVDVCTTGCAPGTPGSGPGALTTPTFIAVDNACSLHRPALTEVTSPKCSEFDPSDGDVYVADTAGSENRITKFNAEGKLITAWGVGAQISGSAAPEGPFKAIRGIATDPEGDLWVQAGEGGSLLLEFAESGTFLKEWRSGLGEQPTGIAVDGAAPEHIYVLDGFAQGPINRFTIDGADEGAVLGPEGTFFTGVATDEKTHELFVDQEGVAVADVSPHCEPTPPNGTVGCTPTQVFGEGNLGGGAGLGVNSATGIVYVASTETDQIASFPVTLEGTTEPATGVTATSAVVHGVVDPKGTPVVHCEVQYGVTESYGQEVPCLNAAGEVVGTEANPIEGPTAVHAALDPVNGGASYHFRLRLGNAKAEFLSSEDMSFKTLAIAVLSNVAASEVTADSATLSALVNPEGVAGTTCTLEWGTSAAYGTTVPCEPQSVSSGSTPVEVKVHLTGLSPGTTYHFNFAVTDADGTTLRVDHTFVFLGAQAFGGCANEGLREANGSTGLPDCRAYELVTPMDKNGALIGALLFNNIAPQLAADGERVIAPSIQCFGGALSCVGTRDAEGEPFQFERGPAGWSSRPLTIPASTFEESSAWGFNADTGMALFSSPSPPHNQDDWYVRAPEGAVSDLGPLAEAEHPIQTIEADPIVSTADFSHVLWEARQPVWRFDDGEGAVHSPYEYPGPEGSTSEPQQVAVTGGPGSHDLIGTCGASVAGKETFAQTYGTVSANGHTTFFQVEPCAHGSGANASRRVPVTEVFARVDGEGPDARTVAISEPAGVSPAQEDPACTSAACVKNTTQPGGFRGAQFEGGSTDGSMAYFVSPQQLTDQATQDPNAADNSNVGDCSLTQGANGCNLYLFNDPQQDPLSKTHLFDVSAGDTSGVGPEVQGMFALSTDGTHAYFVAKGLLSQEANPEGDHAVEGANNLYLYERDSTYPEGHTTFVARLGNALSEQRFDQGIDTANTTPDGRYLVFETGRGLTADATHEGVGQVYRYDAQEKTLQRLSFGRDGFNGNGNAGEPGADAEIRPVRTTVLLRYGPARSDPTMSDDGQLVFFQSPVALTPGALNEEPAGTGNKLAQNVYEWEAQDHGTCTEPGGCIYLLTDGRDTTESGKDVPNNVELLGTDPTGQNVFLATASRLTPADTDTQRDYYDLRVNGGFPVPVEPVPCQGDECHPATTLSPVFGPLASLTFTGPGNTTITPPPPGKPPTKPLTLQQKLIKALKACHKQKNKKKRLVCEHAAHKHYDPKHRLAKSGGRTR